jgi:hypothetical protein
MTWVVTANGPEPNSIWVFRSGSIVSGFVQITSRWQRPTLFRGLRVAIPDTIASRFEIEDIKVGNITQLLDLGAPISGELFATRISKQARLGLVDGEIKIEKEATKEFGRAVQMVACPIAMEMVVWARLKEGALPSMFELMILGREERQ